MKLIYISHPFSGNERENREKARKETAIMIQRFKEEDLMFVNMLDALQAYEMAAMNYEFILEKCTEFMKKCDAVFFCKGWDKSKGCMEEQRVAMKHGMTLLFNERDLEAYFCRTFPGTAYAAQEESMEPDLVDHPAHYMAGGIETIDYIKAKLSQAEYVGYLKGSILKYVSRANYKGHECEDYRKTSWYLNRLIDELEKEGDK
jgi:hypothetical protein|nr:MAG TPA: nucelotide kinase [Caudovirales sp. ctNII2]